MQVKLIGVGGSPIEGGPCLGRQLWILLRHEENIEAEVGVEHEGAAVVSVVAHEEVGHGRLGRSGFQRGMGIDDAGRGEEAGIGNSPDAGVAVIVGNILEQPVDGVVKVGAVVDVLFGFFVVDVRAHLDERALGHVAAAHVLVDENVSRLVEVGRGTELRAVEVDAIWRNAIRSAIDQERVGVRSVLGNVDSGEEADAVAHGDTVFIFRVMRFGVEFGRGVGASLGEKRCDREKSKENYGFSRQHARSWAV